MSQTNVHFLPMKILLLAVSLLLCSSAMDSGVLSDSELMPDKNALDETEGRLQVNNILH